jgi:hypothetical protein
MNATCGDPDSFFNRCGRAAKPTKDGDEATGNNAPHDLIETCFGVWGNDGETEQSRPRRDEFNTDDNALGPEIATHTPSMIQGQTDAGLETETRCI